MSTYRTLRAGVFLPPFHPNDEDPLLCMERDFQLMQWLDAHNYTEAWIGEHHSGGYEIYGQPELFIATAAERTRYIRLGTGVISLPYHHPFMVADRIVQLDYQTRGRAMFGFGPGLLPSDAMMLGIDPEIQRDRMADAIDVITRLLAGEIITQESEWYRMREARLHLRPYSKPRPHLAIASAVTPYGGKLAGRYDLGMLCVAAGSPNGYDTLDYNWELACREAAGQGRVMDRANYRVMAPFHIAETRANEHPLSDRPVAVGKPAAARRSRAQPVGKRVLRSWSRGPNRLRASRAPRQCARDLARRFPWRCIGAGSPLRLTWWQSRPAFGSATSRPGASRAT